MIRILVSSFWRPVLVFVIALALICLWAKSARADELSDLITRLEKKSAPRDKPGQIDKHDIAASDPFAQPPPPKNVCVGCTDLADCVCPPGTCGCPACDKHAAKACPCSPACTCGCNDGQPCRCGAPRSAYEPRHAPQTFRPTFLPSAAFGACRGSS